MDKKEVPRLDFNMDLLPIASNMEGPHDPMPLILYPPLSAVILIDYLPAWYLGMYQCY
jgi:hypothetical protein